jgi:4-hydroxy-3-methylbut-2-enyl diphosphate reductase
MPLKPIAANTGADKKIYLLKPRGFCAGVVRAIDVVKIALNLYGPPVYVRKEIVHNKHVVDELAGLGAIFVEELEEVPSGGGPFSARTASRPRSGGRARSAIWPIIDATCPLVTKVHLEAVKFAREGYTIILIGHKNHDEVIGTLGEAPAKMILVESVEDVDALNIDDPARVAYLTQTTLSLDETKDIVARLKRDSP